MIIIQHTHWNAGWELGHMSMNMSHELSYVHIKIGQHIQLCMQSTTYNFHIVQQWYKEAFIMT